MECLNLSQQDDATFVPLQSDHPKLDPALARRLPADIARRCHAVPVEEHNGQVTVAMADPGDALARAAVAEALGQAACVVAYEPKAIDALLTEVWHDDVDSASGFLVCAHASPIADQVSAFADALGGLLNAHVSYFSPLEGQDTDCEAVARVVKQHRYDLVIWGEPEQPLGQQLLLGCAYTKAIKKIDSSLLLARQPRWPLKHILLVVRGEQIDDPAVDWVVRLARPSAAAITVLAVMPPVPGMYYAAGRMQHGLDALLTTDTALGRQMHRIADWLVASGLEGTLRLRQGIPDAQICCEIAAEDYDLIAVSSRFRRRAARWMLGDRVTSLLCRAERPLLIAKTKTE